MNDTLTSTQLNHSARTDCELLDAMKRNDERAFAELFGRHWRKVHALTLALVRSEEATKEIVHDLFLSLWNNRARLSITHLPGYLHSATKNRVLNHLASEMVQKKHWEYYKEFIPKTANVTEQDVELNALMEALEDGMDHLPEKSKKIFKLNHLDGRSIPEIAHILNLSEKAIQYHITQSVKKLRLHLKDYTLIVQFLLAFVL